MSPNLNIMTRLKFELAYYNVKVKLVSYDVTGTPPSLSLSIYLSISLSLYIYIYIYIYWYSQNKLLPLVLRVDDTLNGHL